MPKVFELLGKFFAVGFGLVVQSCRWQVKFSNNLLSHMPCSGWFEIHFPLSGRGPYHRVAGGYTSTPKHGHEGVQMSVEPRSLAVQLSPPSTPSPPPEEEEENEDYHKDLWVSLQIMTYSLFHQTWFKSSVTKQEFECYVCNSWLALKEHWPKLVCRLSEFCTLFPFWNLFILIFSRCGVNKPKWPLLAVLLKTNISRMFWLALDSLILLRV